jgi:hypothetical protein
MERALEAQKQTHKALAEALGATLNLIDVMAEEPSWQNSPSGVQVIEAYSALVIAEDNLAAAFKKVGAHAD